MSELTRAIRRIATRGLATAAGTGLMVMVIAPAPSEALTLGEIGLRSGLGQPLRATVPVSVAAGELLDGTCIRAARGQGGELAALNDVQIVVAGDPAAGRQQVLLTTARPLYEPMYELALQVQCAGAPALVRQYVLMLDLPGQLLSAEPVTEVATPISTETLPRAESTAPVRTTRVTPAAPAPEITNGTRYRVQPGDSLSSIAARVEGRTVNLWVMADQIFAANRDLFPGGDPNRLPAGVELVIPGSVAGSAPAPVAAESAPPPPAPLPPPVDQAAALPPTLPEELAEPVEPLTATAEADPPIAAEFAEAEVAIVEELPAPPPVESATETAAEEGAVAEESATSPLLAIGAGIGFGLVMSLLLWSRRLKSALGGARQNRAVTEAPRYPDNPTPAPAVTAVRRPEPAISVSYDALDEPLPGAFKASAAAAAVAPAAFHMLDDTPAPRSAPAEVPPYSNDITADLEQLFLDDATSQRPASSFAEPAEPTAEFNMSTVENPTLARDADGALDPLSLGVSLDDDLTQLAQDLPIDIGSEDPADDGYETSPFRPEDNDETIAGSLTSSTRSHTFLEAMNLLEQDYEEELTASQLLDPEMVQAALANGDNSGPHRKR